MKAVLLTALAVSTAGTVMAAAATTAKGVPVPSQLPKSGAVRSQGCWAAKGATWEPVPPLEFPSSGSCSGVCIKMKKPVAGVHAEVCYCGDDYPPEDTYSDDSDCNYPCPGFDPEACGGLSNPGYYNVFNTGVQVDVPNAPSLSTTSTAGSSPTPPGESHVSTPSPPSPRPKEDSKPNSVGIAIGVVVGLVFLAAAVGAGFFYVRKKKRQEEEEERRRAQSVNAFVGNSKPSSISGSFGDSRLDPVMAHRRMSDGSIADNEDYSRKILRVTNA